MAIFNTTEDMKSDISHTEKTVTIRKSVKANGKKSYMGIKANLTTKTKL